MTNKVVSLHSAAFFLERAREQSFTGDVTGLLKLFQQELEREGGRPSLKPAPDEIAAILRRGKVVQACNFVNEARLTGSKRKCARLLKKAERIRTAICGSYEEVGLHSEDNYKRMLRNTA